jgi:hypothetical protein
MFRTFTFVLVGLLLVAVIGVACGSDDENDNAGDTPAIEAPATESDQPVASAEPTDEPSVIVGLAIVTVEGGTTRMDVQDCTAPDDGGSTNITASRDDAELSISGDGDLATIDFTLGADQWIADSAELTIDGLNIAYGGPALKNGADSPEIQILVDVTC